MLQEWLKGISIRRSTDRARRAFPLFPMVRQLARRLSDRLKEGTARLAKAHLDELLEPEKMTHSPFEPFDPKSMKTLGLKISILVTPAYRFER